MAIKIDHQEQSTSDRRNSREGVLNQKGKPSNRNGDKEANTNTDEFIVS